MSEKPKTINEALNEPLSDKDDSKREKQKDEIPAWKKIRDWLKGKK